MAALGGSWLLALGSWLLALGSCSWHWGLGLGLDLGLLSFVLHLVSCLGPYLYRVLTETLPFVVVEMATLTRTLTLTLTLTLSLTLILISILNPTQSYQRARDVTIHQAGPHILEFSERIL